MACVVNPSDSASPALPALSWGSRAPELARWEACANAAFALSALLSAVMRLASTPAEQWHLPAVIGVAAINALIGVLFLIRRPVLAVGTLGELVSCLPTIVGFGLAIRLTPPIAQWPWHAHLLFAIGTAITLTAFLSLGASFAVLPALRKTVDRGPYRIVRHPAYAGELLMAAACLIAGPSAAVVLPWLLLVPGVVWRIHCEERLLSTDPAYAAYGQRIRWRLIPLIW